jgi:hypothetical protein
VAGPLILKQVHSVIDRKTTELCLEVAGQIRPVDEPFETLNGPLLAPPFHLHCRAHVTPWVRGFVSDERRRANSELRALGVRGPSAATTAPLGGGYPGGSGAAAGGAGAVVGGGP